MEGKEAGPDAECPRLSHCSLQLLNLLSLKANVLCAAETGMRACMQAPAAALKHKQTDTGPHALHAFACLHAQAQAQALA